MIDFGALIPVLVPLKSVSMIALGSFTALFPIVNPIGNTPVFMVMTEHYEHQEREKLAFTVALNVFVLLTLFLVVGSAVLRVFNVSLDVVQIAGGLVACQSGWVMMFVEAKDVETSDRNDVGFFPLSMPIFAGPGAMAVAISLSARYENSMLATWMHQGGSIVGIVGVVLSIYICLRASNHLLSYLGEQGTRTLTKLFGFLILAIGIQLIVSGLEGWLTTTSILS